MPECKAVNVTKQDLRNLRTSQQADDGRYIGHRCIKKTQEVKTRPGQNGSGQYQERDYQAYSDDHEQKGIKVIQDIYRYYEEPSNTEIVIGDVKTIPRRKTVKIYVKEPDEVTRNIERKCHQIEETRYVRCFANVSMQSQIYEETRKPMIDASVGSIQSELHEIHKRRNYPHYKRDIKHRKKKHKKCVGLGADSQQNIQVHQKLSPMHIRSYATSPIIATDHPIEVNGQLSKRNREQVVYNSTFIVMRNTADAEEYQPTKETEFVGDSASTVVGGILEDRFMIHNSCCDREEVESCGVEVTDDSSLLNDIFKRLVIDLPNGSATQANLIKWKVSKRRLFKTKQKAKQKQKTTKSINGSKVFLSLRSRFESLRRRFNLKEKQNKTQSLLSPIVKHSSQYNPNFKDDSVSSETRSLVARPYYMYRSHQNINYNNAKVKLLKSKKNLKASLTKQGEKERKTKKCQREVKINLKSNKNAAIRGKSSKKTSRCNVKGNLKVTKISSNPDAKIEIAPNTLNEFKNIQNDTGSWLDQFRRN